MTIFGGGTLDCRQKLPVMRMETHLHQVQAPGSVARRVSGTETYDMTYDAENHLTQVKLNGILQATITYACPEP